MNKSDQPATKKDIENLYKKIKGEFATKDDLKRFATKDDLDDLKEEIKTTLVNFRSSILDAVDVVMGEIKASREEKDVHDFAHDRITNELLDHDQRIRHLEVTSQKD